MIVSSLRCIWFQFRSYPHIISLFLSAIIVFIATDIIICGGEFLKDWWQNDKIPMSNELVTAVSYHSDGNIIHIVVGPAMDSNNRSSPDFCCHQSTNGFTPSIYLPICFIRSNFSSRGGQCFDLWTCSYRFFFHMCSIPYKIMMY